VEIATRELQMEVEQFLFREALLLDEGRYDEWLDLLGEDVWYFSPLVECVDGIEPNVDTEGPHYFDETKQSLRNRVAWVTSIHTPAERPASIKRRIVGNVQAQETDDGIAAQSNFMLWQIRQRESDGTLFVGRRSDMLRRDDGGMLRLVRRRIDLAHPVLPRALSVFF
jgi:3-phenylpropionate/cinnamic acid dioxygenase small subunit